MVPGNAQLFPFDALTAIERCTLHQAISNSVMKNKSHGTNAVCMEIGQKLIGIIFSHAKLQEKNIINKKFQVKLFKYFKINFTRCRQSSVCRSMELPAGIRSNSYTVRNYCSRRYFSGNNCIP